MFQSMDTKSYVKLGDAAQSALTATIFRACMVDIICNGSKLLCIGEEKYARNFLNLQPKSHSHDPGYTNLSMSSEPVFQDALVWICNSGQEFCKLLETFLLKTK